MTNTGPLPPGTKSNFNTLVMAFKRGEACAMQAIDRTTGEEATLVCAVHAEDGEVVITPFAVMVGADVYERYELAKSSQDDNE